MDSISNGSVIDSSTYSDHQDPIQLILDKVDIYENFGQSAGAIMVTGNADLVITDSKIRNNVSGENGGAMRLYNPTTQYHQLYHFRK